MKRSRHDIIAKVHEIFKSQCLTLSAAESCTGGLISHYITSLPGASLFFSAGVVAYLSRTKQRLLGVSHETISVHGVISEETAREMAERIRIITGTDYSVSSTGNLGPDVMEDKEVGLIYVASSKKDLTMTKRLRLNGDRSQNKEEAALAALELLIELVMKNES